MYAFIAGLSGPTVDPSVQATVTHVARCLRARLHADFQVKDVRTKPRAAGADLLAAARDAADWVVLVGRLRVDELGDLTLETTEGQGLDVDKLRRQLEARPARARVLVLDVPAEHVATLAELDFGRCAVRAFGPGVASKLVDALLPDHAGDVTAAAVADALGGTSDEGDYMLNRRVAGDRPASHHDEAFVAYLLGLKKESDRLVFDRATRDEGRARTLADVYEPLYTRGSDDASPERLHLPWEEPTPPQTAHDRVAAHRCVFLVGDPGAGKTSFLQRLAAELCEVALGERAPLPGLPADPLPVFFRLADFKGDPDARALLDQATARLCCAGGRDELPRDAVDDALRAGRLVLLLDGLDEVQAGDGDARQRRRQIAAAIATLAGREASRAHVVATCRPAAAQDGAVPPAPFVRADLLPLEADQITRVATHWLAGRDATEDAAAQARQLTADLGQHAAVRVLAGNPLTLAMICVLAYRQKRLPRDRNELYDELLTLLLEDRDRASPDQARKRRAWLTAIAWSWWQAGGTRDPESIIREDRAARVLQGAGLSEDAAYAEVRFLDERAGLLIWRDTERGYRRLRFAHRSFAEFLVACHLSEKAPAQALIDAGLDPGWEEVARMYVAEHARQDSLSGDAAWDYLRGLLARAETDGEAWPVRANAARLAAECVADWRTAPRVPTDLGERIDKLQDHFLAPDSSGQMPVPERAAFWTAVGPYNRVVKEQSRWVEVPAGRFWFGAAPGDEMAMGREKPARVVRMLAFRIQRWPVTVAEFAAFVDAGGYRANDLWSPEGWAWRMVEGVEAPGQWPVPGRPHHPIVGVSWWEAEAYCNWLSQKEKRRIELPTEAQWEYAARGPFVEGEAVPRYPWGWDDDPDRRAGHGSYQRAVPPGVFPRGVAWRGTWDQSGSVWEWCDEAFDSRLPGGDLDPHRPAAAGGARALRGGSIGLVPPDLRVSFRFDLAPQGRGVSIGFRCVLPEVP